MRVAINAASAQMGGAITYLQNVVPPLGRALASRGGSLVLWAPREAVDATLSAHAERRDPGRAAGAGGLVRRMWFDQCELPRQIREERADALFSSANFGSLRSPVRQVLLVRNSLFFDPLVMQRIPSMSVRAKYLAQRHLVLQSVHAADSVLFPTAAMRDQVARHAGGVGTNWHVAPYGTRHDLFSQRTPGTVTREPAVLLNVSLYCDQKNLGTLLHAMARLQARRPGRQHLRLTASFRSMKSSAAQPHLEAERDLFHRLERDGLGEDVDRQRYGSLPALYAGADVFVFPSYTESFGHPLVEAMATGLPIVASDVPVNREMCGDAAVYFETFDANACADAIQRVLEDKPFAEGLRRKALARAAEFTWQRHVDALLDALQGAD